MKVSIIIFLFSLSFICKGQAVDTSLNYLNGSVIYIVDGAPARKESIRQEEIFSKDILKGEQLNAIYGNKRLDTVTVIITKKGAAKRYQLKLSAFSRDYQSYIESHDNNDDNIQYIVHNDPLEKGEVMNFLYKLPQEKIIGVTFTENTGTGKKIVIIDTKVGE